jgi:uncharacterized protein
VSVTFFPPLAPAAPSLPMSILRFATLFVFLMFSCRAIGTRLIIEPLRIPIIGAPSSPHESFQVQTADGLTLRGWKWVPPNAVATVILVHGKDINRQHLSAFVPLLLNEGFAVYLYDQRAHGQSDGRYTTFGKNEVGDLKRIIDFTAANEVFLIGESLGAAVALQTAASEPRVKAVASAAAFADLRSLVVQKKPFFMSDATRDEAIADAERIANFSIDEIAPEKKAPLIQAPVLLLHGIQDQYIDISHAERLKKALTGKNKLVRLDGVGHVDVLQHEEVWALILHFLKAPHDLN